MEVDLIFKIAAIGITVAVLNQLLIRVGREQEAMLTALAGLIVSLSMILIEISKLFTTLRSLFNL
jgi:stage III sporulation protein AC